MRRSLTGRGGVLAVSATLAMLGAFAATPATGAASDIMKRIGGVVDSLTGPGASGRSFGGVAAVGALFTTSGGKLDAHFCTASVVHSPTGDLAVTAAHCVSDLGKTIVFVPGYHDGKAPYGVWTVTHIYTDQAWQSRQNPDDDVAFLRLDQRGGVPIENYTGAERLGTGRSMRTYVQVIGYPDGSGEPVECANWTRGFSPTQVEFDCGGYTDGTSGGPFLANVDPLTGQGDVIGVIGGYQQGGYTPSVSYASAFGDRVAQLYASVTTPARS